MDVAWASQTAADVPEGDRWLGPRERAEQAGLRSDKRRRDWRLGRWTAKGLLAAAGFPGCEVVKATDGSPVVMNDGGPLSVALSISHRADVSIAALATGARTPLGCDLELVEPRRDAFVRDFFTAGEQRRIDACHGDDRDRLVTIIWSAKESVLKLLHIGLGRDTRSIEVDVQHSAGPAWQPLRVSDLENAAVRNGFWRTLGGLVATVVADDAAAPPRELTKAIRRTA